jgi:hypothetical protein
MSWSKWEFPYADRILNLSVIESTAYWIIQRGTSITLEKMQLQEAPELTASGKMVYLDGITSGTVTQANQTAVTVDGENFVGYPYSMDYTFSTQYKRSAGAGGSQVTDTSGRLQLRQFKLLYQNTGKFNVTTDTQGMINSYSFEGKPLGLLTLGEIELASGTFDFPLLSKNDRVSINVSNGTHHPCAFQSAEWTGYYTTKSRRI